MARSRNPRYQLSGDGDIRDWLAMTMSTMKRPTAEAIGDALGITRANASLMITKTPDEAPTGGFVAGDLITIARHFGVSPTLILAAFGALDRQDIISASDFWREGGITSEQVLRMYALDIERRTTEILDMVGRGGGERQEYDHSYYTDTTD